MYPLTAVSIPSTSFLSKTIETTIFKDRLIWDLGQEKYKIFWCARMEIDKCSNTSVDKET